MGQDPGQVAEVTKWVTDVVSIPVWAKMTPNITDVTVPARAALDGGADGITAINTILSIIGVDLKTLRPTPTVEGHSVPGGYSALAVKPIALRMVKELATHKSGMTISGVGGVTCARDAIEFLLLGSSTIQVCTGAMIYGLKMIDELKSGMLGFLEEHGFASPADALGKSLPYFTTHHHLVELQAERQASKRTARASQDLAWGEVSLADETKRMTANEGNVD
jgi:dihydroorotate dehydrogenase